MQTTSVTVEPAVRGTAIEREGIPRTEQSIEIGLMTACRDRHYAVGLAMALIARGVHLDFVGGDEIDGPELHGTLGLRFLNFRRKLRGNPAQKLWELLFYYARIIRYGAQANPRILHILWNNKLELFDRIILMLYYKLLRKKIALTAHNVNAAKRDAKDSWINRATLRFQYRLCDHIFVHTDKMKGELCREFGVDDNSVTVIRYPITDMLPDTELTPSKAKRQLGLSDVEKVILFFGKLRRYKGIEQLLAAFDLLPADDSEEYRLIVAGEPSDKAYVDEIQETVSRQFARGRVILRPEFIPDDKMEMYFKGADVLVLPYKEIFQSGVLLLAYTFGLPVIATDVGSFREDIVDGRTGYLCKPGDPVDMARAIETYFASDLFRELGVRRDQLKSYAHANYSWQAAAELTRKAYSGMLQRRNP
jgi:D-inositol-3-phosphate glycosyltransferase